jgi:hypothetical protein
MQPQFGSGVVTLELEIRVTRYIAGPEGGGPTEVRGAQRNDQIHNFYFSPDTIRAIGSRRKRWVKECGTLAGQRMYIQSFGGET